MNQVLEKSLSRNGGVLRTEDVQKAGFSCTALSKWTKNGDLERVAHGVYVRAGDIRDELYVLQLRSGRLVFSHETALWLNGLTDRAPLEYHITVPTGAPLGASLRMDCRCHYVKPSLFELGIVSRRTAFGHEVRCYDAERTICDLVRNESKVGVESIVGGLKAYAFGRDKDVAKLMTMAKAFNIENEVARYMGVLI